MEDKKVLLSIKDLQVKFRVRGRILTAIRGVTLDIYENESIAIVGESGAGKSVFTKAFAGMLDSNGFIDQGDIIFNDAELSDTVVPLNSYAKKTIASTWEKLNEYSKLEYGSEVFLKMKALEQEKEEKMTLSEEEREKADAEIKELVIKRTELFNYKQTLDTSKEKAKIKETSAEISRLDGEIKALQKAKEEKIKAHKQAAMNDTAYNQAYEAKMAEYKKEYAGLTAKEITDETRKRNEILAKEIYLSVGRYKLRKKVRMIKKLHEAFKAAMERGVGISLCGSVTEQIVVIPGIKQFFDCLMNGNRSRDVWISDAEIENIFRTDFGGTFFTVFKDFTDDRFFGTKSYHFF